MKHLSLFILGGILITLITGCQSEETPLSGYKFNKNKGVITVDKSNDFRASLTIDMYVMLHAYPSNWTSIVSKFVTDHNNEFNIRIKNKNTAQWYYGSGTGAYVLNFNPSKDIPLNEWVRLTAIRDLKTKTMSLLINNKVVATRTFPKLPMAASSGKNIVLMARDRFTLNGEIADLKIWKTVLTEKELKNSFEIENPEQERKLVGYWKFDNINNGVMVDLSRNKRNGKIIKVK